jgi:hypothetical protein
LTEYDELLEEIRTKAAAFGGQLQNNDDDDLLNFELSLPLKDVWRYMIASPKERESENDFWVKGVLDKRTGKVISATIGRMPQLE